MDHIVRHHMLHSILSAHDRHGSSPHRTGGHRSTHYDGHLPRLRSRSLKSEALTACGRKHRSHSPEDEHTMHHLESLSLRGEHMDHELFRHHDAMGEGLMALHPVRKQLSLDSPRRSLFKRCPTGALMLSLCYMPRKRCDKLTVVVIRVKDLPHIDGKPLPNPYVKVLLVEPDDTVQKKTMVKHRTTSPVFNETFTFSLSRDKIAETNLVASVVDFDLMAGKEEIGQVVVGARGSKDGIRQWNELITRPGYPTTMWHALNPRPQSGESATVYTNI